MDTPEKLEHFYELREQALESLHGASIEKAKQIIHNFRREAENIGVLISGRPLDRVAATYSGNDNWSAVIQTVADKQQPVMYVSFDEHPDGIEI